MDSEALRIINQSLVRKSHAFLSGNSAFIRCPFHPGDDTPSLGVNLAQESGIPVGFFHCFGCGAKGHWNKLAEKLGYPKIKSRDFQVDRVGDLDFVSINRELLGTNNHDIEEHVSSLNLGFHLPWPENEDWRSIPGKLLNGIGAKITYDKSNEDRGIILPVNVNNKTRGVILGTNKAQKKSYIMNPGPWPKKYGLFPFDYITKKLEETKVLTLVEGSRDALRLIKLGIPAVAILGSQSWSDTKANIILSLGLKGVILAFDGDRAGVLCTNKVYANLKGLIPVSVLKLKKYSDELNRKVDPGNMPKVAVKELKRKIEKFC